MTANDGVTMTTEELRAAIETALRRRDARGVAVLLACDESIRATTAHTSDDAIRALALACGLRDDGSDPAEEVERLRAENVRLLNTIESLSAQFCDATRERDEARAALRADGRCDECLDRATRVHTPTGDKCCDAHGVGEGWADTTHAAAVRAAVTR